jgi:malonyl-CoA decarboxylase
MSPEPAKLSERRAGQPAPVGQAGKLLQVFHSLSREGSDEAKLFQEIGSLYRTLHEEEKEPLFAAIVHEIEVGKDVLESTLEKLLASDPKDPHWPLLVSELRNRVHSPRLNILRKISHQPGGLKFLLDLRGDVLSVQRISSADLTPLDMDLVLLFELWFQDGFLYLEEITFDSSYRQIELIKNSDLVHPMTGIEEMGQRLGRDRRCFALYHRLMPYEPVVFIEVALTKGTARSISEIIHPDPSRSGQSEPDTAIFYSINNTQQGLSGLRLGKMLIYRVVDYLRKEKENITTFATLSPMPGFWKGYLKPILEGKDTPFLLKGGDVRSFFPARHVRRVLEGVPPQGETKEGDFNKSLHGLLSGDGWAVDAEWKKVLASPLTRIGHFYLTREKNREGKPLNAVANFHIENGATVSKADINFLANPSPRGLRDSCGIMVNYIYTAGWLSQIRGSLRWLERLEIKTMFSR